MPDRKGLFISFEGGDGAGKSTHLQFVAEALRMHGEEVICLREPGGTIIGEQLRSTVLDPGNYVMSSECELLIYEAARAQLVSQVIEPALARGAIVLCDRFVDSTVAYQAYGRGLDLEFVETASAFACKGIMPERTILMLTGHDAEFGIDRATRHKHADRLEMAGTEFHERVNQGYIELSERYPDRIRVVVSDDTKAATARKVFNELSDLFEWMADESICNDELFEKLVLNRETMGRA
ncbi:MAG: dTMP kinase [Eggerthellaceae bacterium]|nr:dTMP kinase [Eggerthellaceae bacterium]